MGINGMTKLTGLFTFQPSGLVTESGRLWIIDGSLMDHGFKLAVFVPSWQTMAWLPPELMRCCRSLVGFLSSQT